MLMFTPNIAISFLWIAFLLVWAIGILTAKASVKRQSALSRLEHSIPVIASYLLIFDRGLWPHWLRQRFFPQSDTTLVWTGVLLTAAGVGFAIWARSWIGSNWSGTITIKDRHELIQGGPYRIVRHPIYTGMFLGYLGTALAFGEIRGLIGFPLLVLGFGMKLHMEETFMIQQFGRAYADYKHRVKAVVPFLI
jgi:protein-S-isoprenylcysteine O-methyltransferase